MNDLIYILILLLRLYLFILLARVIIDLIQVFSRGWRPTGFVLVLANFVYMLTDPPIKFLRRFIRPINLGGVGLDLSFIVVFIGIQILIWVLIAFASY